MRQPGGSIKPAEKVLWAARIRADEPTPAGKGHADQIEGYARDKIPTQHIRKVAGGELAPLDAKLRDTLEQPDYVSLDASRARLQQLQFTGALETGLDAADTIDARNSLEKMLAHQMAVVHGLTMKMATRIEDLQHTFSGFSSQEKIVEQCRLVNAVSRLTSAFQQGLLTLQRIRSGGSQTVNVHHHHQNVQVNEGGQALVAGKVRAGGRSQARTGGKSRK
jgi:hypothetical protein